MFLIPNPPVSLITSLGRMGFSQLLNSIRALASLGLALTAMCVLGDWLENLRLSCCFLTTLLIFGCLNQTVKGVCSYRPQFVAQFVFKGQGRTKLCSAERGEPWKMHLQDLAANLTVSQWHSVFCLWYQGIRSKWLKINLNIPHLNGLCQEKS